MPFFLLLVQIVIFLVYLDILILIQKRKTLHTDPIISSTHPKIFQFFLSFIYTLPETNLSRVLYTLYIKINDMM